MVTVISTVHNSPSIEIGQKRQQKRQRINKKPSQSLILQGLFDLGCREEGIRTYFLLFFRICPKTYNLKVFVDLNGMLR